MTEKALPTTEKLDALKTRLQTMGRVLVAYSGGVDSAFLMSVAHDVLGADALAVTVSSVLAPSWEFSQAESMAAAHGWTHRILDADPLSQVDVRQNPPDRCYHCKRMIFEALLAFARANQIDAVVDGANRSDESDYRPGSRATAELGIHSPLREVGLEKDEIRQLARARNLENWGKPSSACLASRIPYGTALTEAELSRIDKAEVFLHGLGYPACRVRVHGEVARIELPPGQMAGFVERHAQPARERLNELGYRYVTVDLGGYKMGSLNPVGGEASAKEQGDDA